MGRGSGRGWAGRFDGRSVFAPGQRGLQLRADPGGVRVSGGMAVRLPRFYPSQLLPNTKEIVELFPEKYNSFRGKCIPVATAMRLIGPQMV